MATQDEAAPAPAPEDRDRDASPLVRGLRTFDRGLGRLEQVLLVVLLATVVLVPVINLIGHWVGAGAIIERGDLIARYSVFAIAMIGGAFAAHHQRLLSLDLVSRKLTPRGKALLRIVLALFAVAMTVLLLSQSLLRVAEASPAPGEGGLYNRANAVTVVPIGMALLAVHLVIQAVIEIDYLARGKTAPEPEQGAV
ncbi:MAG: TRAP transporter small permease [Kofleriaceae bacterium]